MRDLVHRAGAITNNRSVTGMSAALNMLLVNCGLAMGGFYENGYKCSLASER